MRLKGIPFLLLCVAALFALGCAQQPIYTTPFTSAAPVTLTPPLAVTLSVTYSKDGQRDAKREQELTVQLTEALASSAAFKLTDAAGAVGHLSIDVEDGATTKHKSLLGSISVSVGHLLVSQQEFTPEGRRTVRVLDVDIAYTPNGGTVQTEAYASPLVTITNNTLEPTDLVPMPDRKRAELTLIGNDLNSFAAELAKAQAAPKP